MAPRPLPMLRNVLSLLSLALLLASVPAGALPMLDLDLDPDAPGVQSTRTAAVGSSVEFEVRITGLEPSVPLSTYSLRLGFDSAILGDGGVVAPDFLGARLATDVSEGEVLLGVQSLLGGLEGDLVLGGFSFGVLAGGVADVLLTPMLEDPEGDPIAFGGTLEGQITAVPEPAAAVLAGLSASVLLRHARRD